jgi:hypothetical protein
VIYLAALLVVAAFIIALRLFHVVAVARDIVDRTRGATATLRAADLDDDAKERAIQAAAGQLLVRFVSITLRAVGALAVPTALLWLLDVAGLVSMAAVTAFLLRWDVIVGLTVVLLVAYLVVQRTTRRA